MSPCPLSLGPQLLSVSPHLDSWVPPPERLGPWMLYVCHCNLDAWVPYVSLCPPQLPVSPGGDSQQTQGVLQGSTVPLLSLQESSPRGMCTLTHLWRSSNITM